MRRTRGMAVTAAAGLALATAAPAAAAGAPIIFAASSLGAAIHAIAPGAPVSLGGSDRLAFQIAQGAPADLFASASPRFTLDLFRKGLVDRPRTFATNRLVVILPAGNPGHVARLGDLARSGVKLVVADPSVPLGAYTRTALARLGLTRALRNVVSEELDATGVQTKVALGEADAGIAYATDARATRPRVRVLAIPERAQPVIRYQVAVLRRAAHRAEAEAVERVLLSPRGRRELVSLGFGVP